MASESDLQSILETVRELPCRQFPRSNHRLTIAPYIDREELGGAQVALANGLSKA